MRQAMRSSGAPTKRAAVEGQKSIRRLRGKVTWKGISRCRVWAVWLSDSTW